MPVGFEGLLNRIVNKDLILPYFEISMLADKWPDKYHIEVDSSPYYGAGDGYFHPSTHALMGERELYLRFHPDYQHLLVGERKSLKGQMTLAMGSALHAVLQTQMEMAGLIHKDDIEVEYINTDHHVRGRIDWIAHLPNGLICPVEFKTRMSWAFKKQAEPEPEWLAQLNLGMDATGHDFGVLLMLESGFPYQMREFHVRRNPALLEDIYAKFDRVRQAIATDTRPRACCAYNSPQMKDCAARFACWLAEDPEMRP
jgi:hypothetical protein